MGLLLNMLGATRKCISSAGFCPMGALKVLEWFQRDQCEYRALEEQNTVGASLPAILHHIIPQLKTQAILFTQIVRCTNNRANAKTTLHI